MTLRFDQKKHNDGEEFLCIGDTAMRKSAVTSVKVIDGKLDDKVVEALFFVGTTHYRHRFNSADQLDVVLRSLGLDYSPNIQS